MNFMKLESVGYQIQQIKVHIEGLVEAAGAIRDPELQAKIKAVRESTLAQLETITNHVRRRIELSL